MSKNSAAQVLSKENLAPFLRSLRVPIAAPVAMENGDVLFQKGVAPEEAAPEYVNSIISPVKFAFPQTQVLLRYRLGKEPMVEAHFEVGPMVIFGLRSCDVTAFRYLNQFFSRPPVDTPFVEAMQNLLLISLTCQEPGPNCFCVCCHAGPFLEEGYDLQLTDFGDKYLVEIGSEKGEQAVEGHAEFFSPAPDELLSQRQELALEAQQKFTISAHFGTGIRKLTTRRLSEEVWELLAARCVECGGCAYVCPLCTCFDVVDRAETPASGLRERTWDCCQYAGYSLEASGHNPRETKVSRFKRRFYHKLSYFYLEQDGRHGCVGCGRCVQTCFGEVDMPLVVNALREETAQPVYGRGGAGR
ncbi:MAG TPA: hypothetical protein EYP85_12920 [Armatimonadetes bacterium]|nr:hypothetical protein [Armatimonadota bacterium]